MKFLYEENQEYTETHELFSAEEIKAHIDRYFKDSRQYFQSFVDRESLSPRQGLRTLIFGAVLTLLMGLGLFLSLTSGTSLSDAQPALFCVLFGLGCLCCLLGASSMFNALKTMNVSSEGSQKAKDKTGLMLFSTLASDDEDDDFDAVKKGKGKKGKEKSALSLPKPKTPREEAFQDLLGRGRLFEGKISQIADVEPNLREITFHFSVDGDTVKRYSYITESRVDLPLYETLVVLSNGTFTVLL